MIFPGQLVPFNINYHILQIINNVNVSAGSIGKGVQCEYVSITIFGLEMLLLKNRVSRVLWKKFILSLITVKTKSASNFFWIVKGILDETPMRLFFAAILLFLPSLTFSVRETKRDRLGRRCERWRERFGAEKDDN